MAGLPLRLVVGLGNPGPDHAAPRHNAGFWFVDELARRHEALLKPERRYAGDAGRATVAGTTLWLLKPMNYMNRSGLAVRAICDYLQLPPAEILVVHDDLDLPPGVVRLKRGGGAGGHNGLKDLISHVGEDFWRLRLGIGHPGDRNVVIDYVLARPPAVEEHLIREAIELALGELPRLLVEGPEKMMNRLHTQPAIDGDGA
jgi:PTH1 family peptidyl-tRNA hydrolase